MTYYLWLLENLLPRMKYSFTRFQQDQEVSAFPFFRKKAENDFDNSAYITVPLVALIVTLPNVSLPNEALPKNKIVIEQIEAIKWNNLNQLSEKINRNESELLPDMKLQSWTKME